MRSNLVLCLLIFAYLTCIVVSKCTDHNGKCGECVADSSFDCGFCGRTGECLTGDKDGPTIPSESKFGGCSEYWQVDFASHVISTTTAYPVNPIEAHIFLVAAQDVNLTVEITRPYSDDVPIDFVVVQDASGSMDVYMELFGNAVPRIMAGLYANYKSSYFAHNSYVDKPIFGFADWDTDYVLQFNTPGLESNPATMQIASKISIESIGYGRDGPEDPHDAVAMILDCQNLQKWRSDARKFTFVATDATFHTDAYKYSNIYDVDESDCINSCEWQFEVGKYDGCRINEHRRSKWYCADAADPPDSKSVGFVDSKCYEPIPPPGSTYRSAGSGYTKCPWIPRIYDLECPPDPTGTKVLTLEDCPYVDKSWGIDVNYISTEALYSKYIKYNTIPIVGSTRSFSSSSRTSNTVTDYLGLFESWGFGSLLQLGEDSDSVVNTILAQIEIAAAQIQLRSLDTDYVNSITPASGYTGVGIRETVTFVINFLHGSPVDNTKVSLVTLGFPSVTVHIWTTVQCFGCDGVTNSQNYVDLCGLCLPETLNSCLGCDDIPYSGAVDDLCGVCGGNNQNCSGCDGIPFSGKEFDVCGICGGNGTTCLDCNGTVNGNLRVDSCGECGGSDACVGCDGVTNSNKTTDLCGYCGGTNVCLGCDGIPNSGLVNDTCGVCGGDNECLGCDGVADSGLVLDECGVCGGDNSSCPLGCDGIRSSNPLTEDLCGVCGGNSSCLGCDFQPYSNLTLDDCGICGGDNYCVGCDGIPRLDGSLPPSKDLCGVCGGNNSCVGCDFIPNSGVKTDLCDVCGGKNECLGCDNIPNSGTDFDQCGVCGGNNSCFDCDGIPNGVRLLDACGVCGGSNSTCSGCDGIPYSNSTFDSCGICNGTNACAFVDNSPIEEPVEIAPWIPATLITIGVVALIAGILAAVAFLSVGAAVGGPLWALPAGLLSQLNSANVSEIHKPREPKVNLRAQ